MMTEVLSYLILSYLGGFVFLNVGIEVKEKHAKSVHKRTEETVIVLAMSSIMTAQSDTDLN